MKEMEFLPAVAMVALIGKLVDFSRYARARDINGVATQLCAWAAGVIVLMLVAHTSWANGIDIGATPLAHLGIWSQVFAGMSAASTYSFAKDALKAIDNTNSAAIPTLVPTRGRRAVAAPRDVG